VDSWGEIAKKLGRPRGQTLWHWHNVLKKYFNIQNIDTNI
jgi:hypothetical protein